MTAHLRTRWAALVSARQQEGDERPYKGYRMRYRTEDQGERLPRHVIETFAGGQVIGRLVWYGNTHVIANIDVEPEYARQGIATAMWDWGQEMSPKPQHSGDRTDMGDAWARSVGGPLPRKKAAQGLVAEIMQLRPQLAQAAQKVLDEWEQDEEGFDEVYGGGGACDAVSEAMSNVLNDRLHVDLHEGGADGDDHAWVVAIRGEEVVGVDIPPGVYERGGGYSWTKIDGAHVQPNDVIVWELDVPASEFGDVW